MKWYVRKQRFLKALVYITALLVITTMALVVFYLNKKPSNSSIYITKYSSIKFDRVNCQSINTDTSIWSFPIVLHYRTPDAQTNFQAKNGYYSARLSLQNSEALYLTTSSDSFEVQNPEQTEININIKAKTFNWDSKATPNDFSLVEHLEWNRLHGNSGDEGSDYFSNIFDWIRPDPLFFTMGLCGEELIYSPAEKAASFTSLNSIALLTAPDMNGSTDSTGKVALLFRFGNVVSFSINNKNYPADEEIQLRVVQKNHSTASGLKFVATEINDSDIAICDGFIHLQPGFICNPIGNIASNSTVELLDLYGSAQELTITSQKGWSEQRLAKTDLPENTKLTVSAQVGEVDISQKSPSIPLEITGDRLSAQANGIEQFQSPWEKLPSELKAVWFTILASFLTSLLGIGFQLSSTLKQFWKWFISKPVYRPPVILKSDTYMFRLINGKKISGIIKKIESRWINPVFVLNEVREWDKDNWGEVLAEEVRVPRNQIEMYYKAHP